MLVLSADHKERFDTRYRIPQGHPHLPTRRVRVKPRKDAGAGRSAGMRGAADGTQGVVITRSVLARGWRELWRAPWGETQEGQHAKGNHHSPFAPPHTCSQRFVSVPMPSIEVTTVCPALSHLRGRSESPTPAGVPRAMRSPGSSVIKVEM